MLPGIAIRVAVRLRDDRNKDNGLEFVAKTLVHAVIFQQSVKWVLIKVNRYVFFEGGVKFLSKRLHKLAYPLIRSIVFVAITYKDIVFKTWD